MFLLQYQGLYHSGMRGNKTFLSVHLILFTFILTILRACPVLLKSSLTNNYWRVCVIEDGGGGDGYDGSSVNVHLGQKKVNESWSMRLPCSSSEIPTHTHSRDHSLHRLQLTETSLFRTCIPLAYYAWIDKPKSRVALLHRRLV